MIRNSAPMVTTALWAILSCNTSMAQVPPPTILSIDLEHETTYIGDVNDYSKLGTDPGPTTVASTHARPFSWVWVISDIVAVNGKPAKGTMIERVSILHLSPTAPSGDTIADTLRTGLYDFNFEIQQADGTPIGSIRSGGVGGGAPPPGAIKGVAMANHPILGGTGAFLGVRGYQGSPPASPAGNNMTLARTASFSEDPANRRILGGGPAHHTLYIIPMSWPEIVATASGPAIVHASDYTLVTTAKPAKSGEILTLFASGLGPTRPALELGNTFAATPLQVANSPVEVTVNGAAAEVLYAGGYPGTTNTYQVNFRLPSGITPGSASLQITAAWIGGPEVKITVQ